EFFLGYGKPVRGFGIPGLVAKGVIEALQRCAIILQLQVVIAYFNVLVSPVGIVRKERDLIRALANGSWPGLPGERRGVEIGLCVLAGTFLRRGLDGRNLGLLLAVRLLAGLAGWRLLLPRLCAGLGRGRIPRLDVRLIVLVLSRCAG